MMELNQWYTYEGFQNGFPTRDFNSKSVVVLYPKEDRVANFPTTSNPCLIYGMQ